MDHDTTHDSSRDGDAGMTLIELLISIAVLGTIVSVIGAAVIVTVRQEPVTRSRLDVAAWEQSLALWLPADLTSAGRNPGDVDATETTTPCAADPACTFGSNALQLTWDDGSGETKVSYRYGPASDGESFELRRVVCKGGSCTSVVILRDLAVPSDDDGNPIAWSAGDPVPDTVINVTVPLAVGTGNTASCDPTDPTDPDCDANTTAQRVIVNVNGAPGLDGIDRSSTVSFTAGGSTLSELDPATFSGPNFIDATSGCGGPVTLIVDESNSLSYGFAGSDIDRVQQGVNSFIDAFEGTPTDLQIVTFGTRAATIGTSGWSKFYDLSDPAEVAQIRADIVASGGIRGGDGGTNWEDALFRTYYAPDGTPHADAGNPLAYEPDLVVFFTDGEPTLDRTTHYTGDPGSVALPDNPPSRFNHSTAGNTNYGADYSPRAWWRASYLVELFDGIRLIGVGVGGAFDDSRQVRRSGWPRQSGTWKWIEKEVFLGDLVATGDPSEQGPSGFYIKREYSPSTGWGDVSNADVLVTTDWSNFGSALTEIALDKCGGTLTVQTRDQAGQPADAAITYLVNGQQVTTTRLTKAGTWDIALNGVASDTVDLVPQSFEGTGYTPVSWNCRAGGGDLVQGPSGDYDLLTADPADGISVTVSANEAVSCTLSVSP